MSVICKSARGKRLAPVPVTDLQVGDTVRATGGWQTVAGITPASDRVFVTFRFTAGCRQFAPDATLWVAR